MSGNIKKRSNTPEIRATQLQESGPHHPPSIKQLIQLLETRTQELEKSQTLMRLALDSVSEGILVVSNHWEILDWNKRMLELWRVPESILAAGSEKLGLNFANNHVVSSEPIIEEVARVYSQPEFTRDLAPVEFKVEQIKIGIDASHDASVHREEFYKKINKEQWTRARGRGVLATALDESLFLLTKLIN